MQPQQNSTLAESTPSLLRFTLICRVQGSDVKIIVKAKDVMINEAKVVTVDIVPSNGEIHAIDSVTMPPGLSFSWKEFIVHASSRVARRELP